MTDTVLAVTDLRASFSARTRASRRATEYEVLHGVDLVVARGETLAVVGESGSGKSVTALSILGLLRDVGGSITSGSVVLGDRELLRMPERQLARLRGSDVGVVFQDPMTSLNPLHKIGGQIAEAIAIHAETKRSIAARARREGHFASRTDVRERVLDLMGRVGLPQPAALFDSYPHQLSGGMRQRVAIAMALANNPKLLVLDEPTTALDVTVQAQILELLRRLQADYHCSSILITHDFGIVAELADRVAVMYEGKVVESGAVDQIFSNPRHAYTKRLLDRRPGGRLSRESGRACRSDAEASASIAALRVSSLVTEFRDHSRTHLRFRAVDHVSFDVGAGETLGIVGESGCGKSTLLRSILRLVEPSQGEIHICGNDFTHQSGAKLRAMRRDLQLVFQDPLSSLDRRMSVEDLLSEPMMIHRSCARRDRQARVSHLLRLVGLSPTMSQRFPHQFSGGQRQRIAIARALAVTPKVLLLDEAVSALDASVQAEIVSLLAGLQEELGLAYIFVSHDLSVVRELSDRVAVMYLGRFVEVGRADEVLKTPVHPYTQALISAIPIVEPSLRKSRRRILLTGDVPSPARPPSGCRFRTRCWKAQPICAASEPKLDNSGSDDHFAACHFPERMADSRLLTGV